MADRFPIIVDTAGAAALKELPSGDNLDLTGSGIVNCGSIAATGLTVGGSISATGLTVGGSISATGLTVGGSTLTPVSSANLADLANVHTTAPTNGQLLAYDNANSRWAPADPAGGGGAWNVINTTTVAGGGSGVSSVEFTLSGYENYALKFTNINTSVNITWYKLYLAFSVDNGSNWLSTVTSTRRHMGSYDSTSTTYHGRDNQVSDSFLSVIDVYNGTNSNTDGMVYIYNNKTGVNNKTGIFHAIDSRGYNSTTVQNPFYSDGAYVVTDSSVINKVKWYLDGNGATSIPEGTFTLYGISTTV